MEKCDAIRGSQTTGAALGVVRPHPRIAFKKALWRVESLLVFFPECDYFPLLIHIVQEVCAHSYSPCIWIFFCICFCCGAFFADCPRKSTASPLL